MTSPPPDSAHITVVISRTVAEVHGYAADLDMLAQWALGIATSRSERHGDALTIQTPEGPVTVRFRNSSEIGNLDHEVLLPDGDIVEVPMRVSEHAEGAEVVLTIRRDGRSDEEFTKDVREVEADLKRLKVLLESEPPRL